MPVHRTRLILALALGLVLTLGWFIYLPGLHGPFLFDDYANLPALGATGPVDTWPTFWRYITSGHADPTGRPLALLSFLVDARNWPADPLPFKRTSVLLHLFNGLLLALLLRRLGRVGYRPSYNASAAWRIDMAALLGAALWLLHPLLVSTTLYIVQREAMLPATFTLLGLLMWLHGRTRLLDGRRGSGVLWMLVGLGGCTVLGVLSKANGILLPALALVIEYTALRAATTQPVDTFTPSLVGAGIAATTVVDSSAPSVAGSNSAVAAIPAPPNKRSRAPGAIADLGKAPRPGRLYHRAMLLLAWLPTTAVGAYLVNKGWQGMAHGISATRPWTLGQRLLTEPRVLMDYLGLLWLPRPFTPGLFNDHIQASTSMLSPASTLPAMLAVLGLIIGACLLRRRWPAAALAVLFYFVGQSLESSTIALELYFEHRNYLPAMLMFWPLALWLCGVKKALAGISTASMTTPPPHSLVGAGSAATAQPRAGESAGAAPNLPVAAVPAPTSNRRQAVGDVDTWARARLVLAIVLIAGLALMTYARASLWGNAHDQALLWAKLNPGSPRAQVSAAQVQMNAALPARAVARLRPRLARSPDQVQLALNLFAAQCQMGHVDAATLMAANISLRTSRNSGTLLTSWFGRAIRQSAHPPCPQLSLATLDGMLDAALSNPHLRSVSGRRQDLYSLKGNIALARHHGDRALVFFNRALDQQVRSGAALQQAAMLGSAGYPALGLAHLQHFDHKRQHQRRPGFGMPRIHAWVLQRQQYWQKEEAYLRATLQADAASKKTSR